MGIDDEWRVRSFLETARPAIHSGSARQGIGQHGDLRFQRQVSVRSRRDTDAPNSSHDLGKDIIPPLVPRYRVFAQPFQDSCVGMNDNRPYWRDVGTVDAYWEANIDLVHVTPDLNLYENEWPIWTFQEQLPPAKFVFDDEGRRGMAVDSLVSGGCIISGSGVKGSLVFSNVRVHSFSTIEDSVILPDVVINRACETAPLRHRQALRSPRLCGRFDPEQDRKRFRVSERGITLITPGMLGQKVFLHR
jgi:glucose-1-phosphate adenylyltransferase